MSSREQPISVAEVVRRAHRAVDALGLIWVEGEVAQATKPASGHLYFTLRDKDAVLPCVMWGRDTQRLKFRVDAGQRLRVRGRLGVYDRDGRMQLYVDFAEPAGLGAEALALQQLKDKLAAEGIFAQAKKRPLPKFPRRIGVVTSRTGAAVHDIIRTVQRRFPTPIVIADAAVQGATAPAQIVQGMAMVVRAGVDIVIVGRGGGAVTDLTAFNHERVVRTIARCPVPVISAVGHEIDLSLADLAADARASTPTAAAELAVPDGAAIVEWLAKERRRLDREITHVLDRARQDLDRATLALQTQHPRVRIMAQGAAFDELARRGDIAIAKMLERRRAELARVGAQIAALSPLAVLDRGYAMVRKGETIVRDVEQISRGDKLRVSLARGTLGVVVEDVE